MTSRPSRYVAVRDSKNPDGPVLDFSAAAWSALVTEIKQDMLDL